VEPVIAPATNNSTAYPSITLRTGLVRDKQDLQRPSANRIWLFHLASAYKITSKLARGIFVWFIVAIAAFWP